MSLPSSLTPPQRAAAIAILTAITLYGLYLLVPTNHQTPSENISPLLTRRNALLRPRPRPRRRPPTSELKSLLYALASSRAQSEATIHRGIKCSICGVFPIRGVRYSCLNCPCEACEACEGRGAHKQGGHVFGKIRVPVPGLMGRAEYGLRQGIYGQMGNAPVEVTPAAREAARDYLVGEHDLTVEGVEAYMQRFEVLMDTVFGGDNVGLFVGIGRGAFGRFFGGVVGENGGKGEGEKGGDEGYAGYADHGYPSVAPTDFEGSLLVGSPSADHGSVKTLIDRIFAFYDVDGNGVIGLDEFISGQEYLHGPKAFEPLDRAVKGFDFDDDGFISPRDIKRLVSAKLVAGERLIDWMIWKEDEPLIQAAMGDDRGMMPHAVNFIEPPIGLTAQGDECSEGVVKSETPDAVVVKSAMDAAIDEVVVSFCNVLRQVKRTGGDVTWGRVYELIALEQGDDDDGVAVDEDEKFEVALVVKVAGWKERYKGLVKCWLEYASL